MFYANFSNFCPQNDQNCVLDSLSKFEFQNLDSDGTKSTHRFLGMLSKRPVNVRQMIADLKAKRGLPVEDLTNTVPIQTPVGPEKVEPSDYDKFFEHIQSNGMEVERCPEEFYSQCWGAVETAESKFNYFGGLPLVDDSGDMKWPSCQVHGPLHFLWSMEDVKRPNEIVQFFCCVKVDYHDNGNLNSIETNGSGCANSTYSEQTCGVNICDDFGYVARRVFKSDSLKLSDSHPDIVMLPRVNFKWEILTYLDVSRVRQLSMKFNSYYELPNQKFIHSDCIPSQAEFMEEQNEKYLMYHRCSGVSTKGGVGRSFGYITMMWRCCTRVFPFYHYRNPMYLNMDYNLTLIATR